LLTHNEVMTRVGVDAIASGESLVRHLRLTSSIFMTLKASSMFAHFDLHQATSGVLDFLQNMAKPRSHRARALQSQGLNFAGAT
jgi:hypothetical protein